jgi:hypothetical protein
MQKKRKKNTESNMSKSDTTSSLFPLHKHTTKDYVM